MKIKRLPYTSSSSAITGYSESVIAKKENSDCVVRAIASSSDMTYDKAHKWVSDKFNRKPKKGTFGFAPGMNGMCNDNTKLNRKTVTTIPSSNLTTNNGKSKMTVGTFIREYNKGTYILRVTGHAFTIKDGVVIGNWEDSTKIRRVVKNAWRIGKS
jgi:hypothetical protein